MSPTARTLAECRKRGWIAQVVEQTIPRTFIKRDLFGCIDIIAVAKPLNDAGGIIGIQVTSGSNHAARLAKAKAEPRIAAWLSAGAKFFVWSWAKQGARGERKRWMLREESL